MLIDDSAYGSLAPQAVASGVIDGDSDGRALHGLFSSFAGRKAIFLLALILMASPVAGLVGAAEAIKESLNGAVASPLPASFAKPPTMSA
jgi:hypothetical protein